ncbi:MAG: hypothetical protein INH12_21475 [Cupriavidus sp.]|nr:hypothetical protein [Cupriavidus sp.]QWE96033.1 hypothetical protein KLP38_11780 [Cupriavidus sp. EM10]MCA3192652.1 hypothetical protein [Cupriavidus sp.]MCA3194853.1 hypothetical protein [Cupriavidus sp.]MCA3200491.1 hypothetical protein [Cupriavidus sp.]
MTNRIYEIWEAISPTGVTEVALLEAGQIEEHRALFVSEPTLLTSFEADSYIEAAQKRNDFFGWEKYHPMKEDLDDNNDKEDL